LDLRVPKDQLEVLLLRVLWVLRELKDQLVHKDPKDQMVLKEARVLKGLQELVLKVSKVSKEA
jgi:hypothetical protein